MRPRITVRHCKIRLSLGSVKTSNQSIFHWSNILFILIQMYQGFIPKKMNAKSHPARQLAPIAFLAQTPEMCQLRVNYAPIARQVGMGVHFIV